MFTKISQFCLNINFRNCFDKALLKKACNAGLYCYCLIRVFTEIPSHLYTTPLIKKLCKTADRVRSMCFNHRRSEIVVISSNGFIHCWDGLRYLNLIFFKTLKQRWVINFIIWSVTFIHVYRQLRT